MLALILMLLSVLLSMRSPAIIAAASVDNPRPGGPALSGASPWMSGVDAPAGWPMRTFHTCSGEHWGDVTTRACKFENVVFDRLDPRFWYYTPDAETLRGVFTNESDSMNFVQLGADRGAWGRYRRRWSVNVNFTAAAPPGASAVCDVAAPTYLHMQHRQTSFGHVLRDNFNEIAYHVVELGEGRDYRLVVTEEPISPLFLKYHSYVATDIAPWKALLRACDRRFLLFRDLIVVLGIRSRFRSAKKRGMCRPAHFAAQRAVALRLAGLPPVSVADLSRTKLLLLEKRASDKRRIANADALLPALRARFPALDVEADDLRHLTAAEQLRLLSGVSVLVTTIGSASFRLVYLPVGAHVVLIGAPEHHAPIGPANAFREYAVCWADLAEVKFELYHVVRPQETLLRYRRQGVHSEAWLFWDADVVVDAAALGDLVQRAVVGVVQQRTRGVLPAAAVGFGGDTRAGASEPRAGILNTSRLGP